MPVDVAGSDFLKGVEYLLAAFYFAVAVIAIAMVALVWAMVAVIRGWFNRKEPKPRHPPCNSALPGAAPDRGGI
jgi:hypothetical protein